MAIHQHAFLQPTKIQQRWKMYSKNMHRMKTENDKQKKHLEALKRYTNKHSFKKLYNHHITF